MLQSSQPLSSIPSSVPCKKCNEKVRLQNIFKLQSCPVVYNNQVIISPPQVVNPGIEISSSSIICLGFNAASWLVRLSITVLLHQCEDRRSSSQYPVPLRQLPNCHASTHVLINDIHITLMVRRDIICSISIPAVSPHARPRAVLTDCCLRLAALLINGPLTTTSGSTWCPGPNVHSSRLFYSNSILSFYGEYFLT